MKLCVSAAGFKIDGYTNVTVYPGTPTYANLDKVVSDAEALEIIAEDVLEHVSISQLNSTLDLLIKKLRHGGTLIVSGVDPYQVAYQISIRGLDLTTINNIVYGASGMNHCMISLQELAKRLEEKGLKILHKRYDDLRAIVTAQRI